MSGKTRYTKEFRGKALRLLEELRANRTHTHGAVTQFLHNPGIATFSPSNAQVVYRTMGECAGECGLMWITGGECYPQLSTRADALKILG